MMKLHQYFRVVLMLYIVSGSGFAAVVAQTNETDRLALLDLKMQISDDPFQIMMSWNVSTHFCNWKGVICDPSNRRVLILNLTSQQLVGSIPPSIGNLTLLTAIDLGNNSFHGGIPQEIGHLLRLRYLNLTSNAFGGSIPTNLSCCQELRVLDLTDSKLVGNIPDQLSSLTKMLLFGLGGNNLTGGIPTWIANFSALERLSLARNHLEGNIPADLGRLTSLRLLKLHENQLSGTVPSEIFNISSLNLFSLNKNRLQGELASDIGIKLPNLDIFTCAENQFTGEIPVSIGNLTLLTAIDLSNNNFHGSIPINLNHCRELRTLEVSYNELVGSIPYQLSSLTKMMVFGLEANRLTGGLPTWIANFSRLQELSVARNRLEGNIPADLGSLTSLRILILYGNQLSGTIPSEIFNISSIVAFAVGQNQLHGELPSDVGITLPNLEFFSGALNRFTGELPSSLANTSKLSKIDFARNALTGTLPTFFGNLQDLYWINFEYNYLGSKQSGDLSFLSVLDNCTRLEILGLRGNNFGGELPNSVANLSVNLRGLSLGSNILEGSIPLGIGNLVGLTILELDGNSFSGHIPDTIGKLQYLRVLRIYYNKFSGGIPYSIGNLTLLTELRMEDNSLEGTIPTELGNCGNLIKLNLNRNNLTGTIPIEIMGLSSLSIYLAIAQNTLSGPLPFEIGKLVNLMQLDLSNNELSGEIPSTLSSCLSLERLTLHGNFLRGRIPESIKALRGLGEMDLSHNNFSGEIPDFLGNLSSLKKLNLSFNNFDGKVSNEGIFANASAISVVGNKNLCGGISDIHLPKCPIATHKSKFPNLKVLIPTSISIVFLGMILVGAAFYARNKSRKKALVELSSSKDGQLRVSYHEVFQSTDGFSANNLIGSGSFGSVYKGVLGDDGLIVAVKILNLEQRGASRSFIDECNVLRSTRHRNLLKIVTVCSSIDPEGNDFKCIISEFMSNGNIDQWLHPVNDDPVNNKCLAITQRLDIAIDVASAMDYLHNCCEIPVVHCDIKPSNILLDEDMTAHVGDFGLAKFLFEDSTDPRKNTISDGLKGSIGYIPPEYGSGGRVSTAGDVYSYGILLLELFTGKRPTDDIFGDDISIHEYVKMALAGHAIEILDPLLLLEEENQSMVSVLRIGFECSKLLPGDRMPIDIALNRMQKIRENFCGHRKLNASSS